MANSTDFQSVECNSNSTLIENINHLHMKDNICISNLSETDIYNNHTKDRTIEESFIKSENLNNSITELFIDNDNDDEDDFVKCILNKKSN